MGALPMLIGALRDGRGARGPASAALPATRCRPSNAPKPARGAARAPSKVWGVVPSAAGGSDVRVVRGRSLRRWSGRAPAWCDVVRNPLHEDAARVIRHPLPQERAAALPPGTCNPCRLRARRRPTPRLHELPPPTRHTSPAPRTAAARRTPPMRTTTTRPTAASPRVPACPIRRWPGCGAAGHRGGVSGATHPRSFKATNAATTREGWWPPAEPHLALLNAVAGQMSPYHSAQRILMPGLARPESSVGGL